ncbi:MAG: hypothetical protein HC859_10810 [Bacteroidia bacterium]|nr:hypothetical protein [Bacteroidia bacterium]
MLAAGAVAAAVLGASPAAQAQQIRFVGERYPALEFYAEKLKTAIPGVSVTVDLMPNAPLKELQTITLSSGASTIDIFLGNDLTITNFAANGWLERSTLTSRSTRSSTSSTISPRAR